MHRIDGPGATIDNRFTDGDPVGGVQATMVTDDWANDVQEELISVLLAASITPVKGTQDQLLKAIRTVSGNVVGAIRNLRMFVGAASASATIAADQIQVGATLSGQTYRLSSFNKTINLAAVGVGGMDIGTAPVSGYVALYAIYNPATGVSALLAVNATSSVAPNIYGGANMPAGYTASALLTVLPTNASSQFKICIVRDRSVFIIPTVLFTNNSTVTNQVVSISGVVPQNALAISGQFFMSSTSASVLNLVVQPDTTTIAQMAQSVVVGANAGMITSFPQLPVSTPQQIVVTTSSTVGTPTFTLYATEYSI